MSLKNTKPATRGAFDSWKFRFAKRLVLKRLDALEQGALQINDPEGIQFFGDAESDLRVEVVVRNPRFYWRLMLSGGLGAAESLMDGDWECNDLTAFVRLFVRNLNVADQVDKGASRLRQWGARMVHALRRNTIEGAKRNIRDHYDLSNEFYSLWLDETMAYSSGLFLTADATMADASRAKFDAICRKLELGPADHVVEVGTGWGGFAIHAARHFGCRVTTTTISDAQYAEAKARIEEAGLSDRITLLCRDYRELEGTYDKLVSIEMIEAVGHEFFREYFAKCSSLLKPDGVAVIQAIVITDERYEEHLKSVDFIRQYIFPGGCLPSISAMCRDAAYAGGLRLLQLQDLAPHYAETLRRWRDRFQDHLEEVRALGFDDRFIRMWNYYFCYCEAVFEERQVNVVQAQFAKRGCRFDPIRQEANVLEGAI